MTNQDYIEARMAAIRRFQYANTPANIINEFRGVTWGHPLAYPHDGIIEPYPIKMPNQRPRE